MIISFIGHSRISQYENIKAAVSKAVRNNLCEATVSCYLGGYGDFDELCACVCRELKQEYLDIELVYVAPYLNLREQDKIREIERLGLYDTSVYPPIENTPLRFAIVKRNEWMVLSADLIICYVEHEWGGAYKTLKFAKHKKKKIINVCDYL